jgi:uncharacterized protein
MKKQIYITGMHCVSCEKLLDNEFRKLSGFQNAKFDRKNDSAEIEYDQTILTFDKIRETAQKFGYKVSEKKPESLKDPKSDNSKANFFQWINSILIVVLILFLYRIFQNLGFLDKIGFQGSGINFGVAFLVGIVASLSSCLAVVGAVVIAFNEKYKASGGTFSEYLFSHRKNRNFFYSRRNFGTHWRRNKYQRKFRFCFYHYHFRYYGVAGT